VSEETEKYVRITLKEYKRLVRMDAVYSQAEEIGIDNWSGWGEFDSSTGRDGQKEIEDALAECDNFVVDVTCKCEKPKPFLLSCSICEKPVPKERFPDCA